VLLRIARRIRWGLADQALSSLTNFVLGIVVARTVGLTEFGAFGLAFTAYLIVTGVGRAVTGQPLLIRYSGVETATWRSGAAAATGAATVIGLAASVVAFAVALAGDGPLRAAFLALALVLPGLVLQDSWRFAFFASGRGRDAFLNDLVWAIVQLAAFLLAIALGEGTVFWAVIAWGGAATLAAFVGIAQARVLPRPTATRRWSLEHRDLLPAYIGETAAYILAGQLVLYAIGLVAGLAVVGALRGAQLLLGPLNVVVQGFYLVAVPEAVRVLKTSTRRFAELCLAAGLALAGVAIAWTLFLVLLPDSVGQTLLGDVWPPAHSVLLAWGLSFAAINLGYGASIGLRALAAAPRTLRAAVVTSIFGFVGAVVGAMVGGLEGTANGFLLTQVFGIGVWWWEFRGGLRDHAIAGPDSPADIAGSQPAGATVATWNDQSVADRR
jgi:O-antigen/teichoic acid export membrane protein